jgi:hypothetical protein
LARVVILDKGKNQGNTYHAEGICIDDNYKGIEVTLEGNTKIENTGGHRLHGTGSGEMKAKDGTDSIKYKGQGEGEETATRGKKFDGSLGFAIAVTGARFAFLNNMTCTYTYSEKPDGASTAAISKQEKD